MPKLTSNQEKKVSKLRDQLLARRSAYECSRIVESVRGFNRTSQRRILQAALILVG